MTYKGTRARVYYVINTVSILFIYTVFYVEQSSAEMSMWSFIDSHTRLFRSIHAHIKISLYLHLRRSVQNLRRNWGGEGGVPVKIYVVATQTQKRVKLGLILPLVICLETVYKSKR